MSSKKIFIEETIFRDMPMGEVLVELGEMQLKIIKEIEKKNRCFVRVLRAEIINPRPTGSDPLAQRAKAVFEYTVKMIPSVIEVESVKLERDKYGRLNFIVNPIDGDSVEFKNVSPTDLQRLLDIYYGVPNESF